MKLYAKTRKSHYWNEDRFVINKDFLMVIDGASPLIKDKNFNEAKWLVSYLKKNLKTKSGRVIDRLKVLIKQAYQEIPVEVKEEEYLPSASMSWIEWDDNNYYISVLGDCEVTCITNDNQVERFYDDALSKLDDIALEKMKEVALEKKIDIVDARPFIKDVLMKHRKLINKPNGYHALALSSDLIIEPICFTIKKELVKEIYLYSDGFSAAFGNLKIYASHKEMFSKSLEIDEEINKIVKRTNEDSKANIYPRFKKIDDITVIKVIKEM